jgi:hypothetical protein
VLPNSILSQIWFWSHFVVLLKSDLNVQQTHLRILSQAFYHLVTRGLSWVSTFRLSRAILSTARRVFRRRLQSDRNFKLVWTGFTRTGANVIKLFLSVIYGFSCKARVFLRQNQKSLPMTNALAYYKTRNLHTKKFITLGLGANVIKMFTPVSYAFSK